MVPAISSRLVQLTRGLPREALSLCDGGEGWTGAHAIPESSQNHVQKCLLRAGHWAQTIVARVLRLMQEFIHNSASSGIMLMITALVDGVLNSLASLSI